MPDLQTVPPLLTPEPRPRAGLTTEQPRSRGTVFSVVGFPVSCIKGGDVNARAIAEDGATVQRKGAGVLALAGAQRAAQSGKRKGCRGPHALVGRLHELA